MPSVSKSIVNQQQTRPNNYSLKNLFSVCVISICARNNKYLNLKELMTDLSFKP